MQRSRSMPVRRAGPRGPLPHYAPARSERVIPWPIRIRNPRELADVRFVGGNHGMGLNPRPDGESPV